MAETKYLPVERCIYCHKTASDAAMARLQDEHIVAYSLGGNSLLPRASCSACGAMTGADEGFCAGEMLKQARAHFHWQSRNSKRPEKLRAGRIIGQKTEWWDIPISDHPPTILLPEFEPPGILTGRKPEADGIMLVGLNAHFAPEFYERQTKLGNGGATFSVFESGPFCRMLAKIAHAFVVAELGYGSFIPFLPEVILRKVPYFAHVVGSGIATGLKGVDLHEVSHFWSRDLLVCRIRLFARLGLGPYLVVCGRKSS